MYAAGLPKCLTNVAAIITIITIPISFWPDNKLNIIKEKVNYNRRRYRSTPQLNLHGRKNEMSNAENKYKHCNLRKQEKYKICDGLEMDRHQEQVMEVLPVPVPREGIFESAFLHAMAYSLS